MVYNIYKGGQGRVSLLTQTVNETAPDILGVLEANGWDTDEALRNEFVHGFHLPFFYFAKANTKYDMAIFSALQSLQQIQENVHLWHTAIFSTHQFPVVGETVIVLVHLNPKSEEERVREIKFLFERLKPYKNVILFGDFNSLNPHDPYDRSEVLKRFQERNITKYGTNNLLFDAIQYVLNQGFVEAMDVLGKPYQPTVPTQFNSDPDHEVPVRLDCFFISPSLRKYLCDAVVVRNEQTDAGSDHYPVYVDFDFS